MYSSLHVYAMYMQCTCNVHVYIPELFHRLLRKPWALWWGKWIFWTTFHSLVWSTNRRFFVVECNSICPSQFGLQTRSQYSQVIKLIITHSFSNSPKQEGDEERRTKRWQWLRGPAEQAFYTLGIRLPCKRQVVTYYANQFCTRFKREWLWCVLRTIYIGSVIILFSAPQPVFFPIPWEKQLIHLSNFLSFLWNTAPLLGLGSKANAWKLFKWPYR